MRGSLFAFLVAVTLSSAATARAQADNAAAPVPAAEAPPSRTPVAPTPGPKPLVATPPPLVQVTDEAIGKLEERLLAPCCYKQTLQTHESPLASALRREIRERLGRGEASGDIEADIVRRYGPEVRAIPPTFSLAWFGLWPFVFGLSIGAVVLVMRARKSRHAPTAATDFPPVEDQHTNDRIDDELDRLA